MPKRGDARASVSRLRHDDASHVTGYDRPPQLVFVAPPNQAELSNQEKYEDVQRTLRWNDPNVVRNEVKFVYAAAAHRRFPAQPEEHLAVHFAMDGCCLFEDSDEAKAQRLRSRKKDIDMDLDSTTTTTAAAGPGGGGGGGVSGGDVDLAASLEASDGGGDSSGGDGDAGGGSSATLRTVAGDAFKNEFNFAERACQTPTVPVREIGITTVPPPVERFTTTVTQWKIYDLYVRGVQQERRDSEMQALAQDHSSSGGGGGGSGGGGRRAGSTSTSGTPKAGRRPQTAPRRPLSRALSMGEGGLEEAAALRGASRSGSDALPLPQIEGWGSEQFQAPATRAEQEARDLSREELMRSPDMLRALHVLERIVNQNREDDIYQDFKYWEDDSDRFKEGGEGSLLPLWRFTSDRTKHTHVTCMAWHPTYHDLFAVAYGSYDFTRQSEGLVYCFSLKNTSYPQFMFQLECGAMCLDWHPQHHALLCVGCYDGSVIVYDVRIPGNMPIFRSTVRTGKHTDPVWEVRWQEEDISKGLNFFSVSSDGLVANWTLSNTELRMETLMRLEQADGALLPLTAEAPGNSPLSGRVSTQASQAEEGALLAGGPPSGAVTRGKALPAIAGLEAGVCVDFNKHSDHLFIVGTEEGHIHKCSKAYSGQYLQSFAGHDMTVYSLQWNPFHPQVFISCSCDWTVKIWRHDLSEAQLTLSLGDTVGDVQWAPYSSTVFAAITNDGFVHVYDLSVNRHEPVCKQKVVKRSKLTKLRFSAFDPILLVGDETGAVTSMKLSPNLRKNMGSGGGVGGADVGGPVVDAGAEKQRLDSCLRIGTLMATAKR